MSRTENSLPPAEERSLAVEMKLYYDLSLPQSDAPAPLLIALHGYGGNKRQMMREGQLIAPRGFAVASLQGPHQHMKEAREEGGPFRYAFGWLTNFRPEESIALHHRALLDLIEELAAEALIDPARVFLLGFSQSCALNYRFAFTHTQSLRGVVGICGGLPGDWETGEAYKETSASVLHLSGTRDQFYTPERTADYLERLRTRARDVEARAYDAAHEITQPMREQTRAWLQERAG